VSREELFCASRASNCTESVDGKILRGKPNSSGLKGTCGRNAPRREEILSGCDGSRIEVIFDQPVVRRDVGDEIAAGHDVAQNAWRCTDPGNSVLIADDGNRSAVE